MRRKTKTKQQQENDQEPESVNQSKKQSVWDEKDKLTLLSALKKYGYTDIDRISNDLPEKSKPAIRTMINKLHATARKTGSRKHNLLDAWLHTEFFCDPNTMIPEALKYISIFEDHPPPEEAAGCDFKALYDLLYRSLLGHPPVEVSRMTQETVLYTLNQITEEVYPQFEREVCEFINNLEQEKARKVYRNRKETDPLD